MKLLSFVFLLGTTPTVCGSSQDAAASLDDRRLKNSKRDGNPAITAVQQNKKDEYKQGASMIPASSPRTESALPSTEIPVETILGPSASQGPSNLPSNVPSNIPSIILENDVPGQDGIDTISAVPSGEPSASSSPSNQSSFVPSGSIEPSASPAPSLITSALSTESVKPSASSVPSLIPSLLRTESFEPSASPGPNLIPSLLPTESVEPNASSVPSNQPLFLPSDSIEPSVESVEPSASLATSFLPSLITNDVPSSLDDFATEVDSKCSAHPKCTKNGLEGDCCPTIDGVFLYCCEAVPSLIPSLLPTDSVEPSASSLPINLPSFFPTTSFERSASSVSSLIPSLLPTASVEPSASFVPSNLPSLLPTDSVEPSASSVPSSIPPLLTTESVEPSASSVPSLMPSLLPTESVDFDLVPSLVAVESSRPSDLPSLVPTGLQSDPVPSVRPSTSPGNSSDLRSFITNGAPSDGFALGEDRIEVIDQVPSLQPSASPVPRTDLPSVVPSGVPSDGFALGEDHIDVIDQVPSLQPSASPGPSSTRSDLPSLAPSDTDSLDTGESDIPTVLNPEGADLSREAPGDPYAGGIPCDLDASAQCETENGSSCSTLQRVPEENLMCRSSPKQLEFLYTGGSCASSTSSEKFSCQDMPGSASSSGVVYVEILGESTQLYYQGYVNSPRPGFFADSIKWGRSDTTPMENIFLIIRKDNPQGDFIQKMSIHNLCHPKHGLMIGKAFGALTFGSYQSSSMSIRGFENLKWTYTAQSDTGLNLTMKAVTTITGDYTETVKSKKTLSPEEEVSFIVRETISLSDPSRLTGAVTAVAQSADGVECAATAALNILLR